MGYNILLVDDDVSQLRILDRMISNKVRYQTKLANSGQEALDILSSPLANDIDLVLLDLLMPGIDGVNVLKRVRALRPSLPFVVRSAYDDVKTVANAMKEGADDFVHKLESADKLKFVIEQNLSKKKQRKLDASEFSHTNTVQHKPITTFEEKADVYLNHTHEAERGLYERTKHLLELETVDGHMKPMQELEKEIILHALKHYNFHMSKVAKHLGIGRSTLYRKLDEYGIDGSKREKKCSK